MASVKLLLRWLFRVLYRVEVKGLEHYTAAGKRVLIIANHTSYLDGLLLGLFLPDRPTFAIDTQVAQSWYMRAVSSLVDVFPMDPANPLSTKSLIKYLQQDRKAVIFPEGRITVTGALMKIYQGPGLVADRSGAQVLPVRIDGAQYTPFSHLRGRVRLRWFPRITLTLLPPQRIALPAGSSGRDRRNVVGQMLADIMSEMVFATSNRQCTLFDELLDARRAHGGGHLIVEDMARTPLSYNQLISRCFILGRAVYSETRRGEHVGIMMPSAVSTVCLFFGLHIHGRVPAMLNFSAGIQSLLSAVETAGIETVYTSRRFIETANLQAVAEQLDEHVKLRYLEDVGATISFADKLRGVIKGRCASLFYNEHDKPRADDAAVVLFTSGSEGTPKGVVLSHANLLANGAQLATRLDFSAQDTVLNVLPVFHSFGLSAGTLLPLVLGMRVFFYPSPLHYRVIPEIAYEINATVLFGTNTFLAGYARHAHPYDFYSLRYVFAGAEKLQEGTRRVWAEKFGLRILEGYGATETSPVLTANTRMDYRAGSVGRFFPGIEHRLQAVEGIDDGGRLLVKGPNVMLGYLLHGGEGRLVPPTCEAGDGWYDTGDIVRVDDDGFVWIRGRAKRFAKIGGEMVSLAAAEELAVALWPDVPHAVVALPDAQKGEQLVLLTEQCGATRRALQRSARQAGGSDLSVPKCVLVSDEVPLLGSGKVDYAAVRCKVDTLI
ncbi:MAG: AMP-binding protein [Gammaproteobacteria bacterium]|nr:AMP-binding protein [Gammaproteobacteria bacterium]